MRHWWTDIFANDAEQQGLTACLQDATGCMREVPIDDLPSPKKTCIHRHVNAYTSCMQTYVLMPEPSKPSEMSTLILKLVDCTVAEYVWEVCCSWAATRPEG